MKREIRALTKIVRKQLNANAYGEIHMTSLCIADNAGFIAERMWEIKEFQERFDIKSYSGSIKCPHEPKHHTVRFYVDRTADANDFTWCPYQLEHIVSAKKC